MPRSGSLGLPAETVQVDARTETRNSEPAFLSNATGIVIQDSTFHNVGGHSYNLNNSVSTTPNQIQPATPQVTSTIMNHPSSSVAPAMAQDDSEVYARLLLPKKLGFPLWLPQPHNNLPSEYRRNGVNIGDVGIVRSSGVFDFLFNICLPSHHPINGSRVPDGFRPLETPELIDIIEVAVASTHITSGSIERLQFSAGGPIQNPAHAASFGAGFSFQCSASEGAILTLPDGASRMDFGPIARFREYAVQNAESWYNYVNGPRGREAENGSIYLVTGCDKSKSWGVASFSDVSGSFTLTFIPASEGGNDNCGFYWEQASLATTNSGPIPIEYFDSPQDRPQNQCTFIRGFKVSLSEGLWATLLGRTSMATTIVDAKPDDILSRSSFVPFHGGGSWFRGFFSNFGGQGSRGNEHASEGPASDETGTIARGGDVITTSDFPPTSYPYHPSNIINEHLLEQEPDAHVAITHDNDWCAVIGDDEHSIPNASELLSRMHSMYDVRHENGAVSLVPNHTTSPVEDIFIESIPSLNPKSLNTNTEVEMPNNECMERNLIDPIKKLAHHAAKFVRPPRITAFFQNLFARRIDLDEINTQDIVIIVVGPSGAGKSTFINTATKGSEAPVGNGLAPHTEKVQGVRCAYPGDKNGRNVVFVDTPAFDDDMKKQAEIGKSIKNWLSRTYAKKIRVAGILYMQDVRMTERPLAHLAKFEKMCGDVDFPQRTLLVTTKWRSVDEAKGSRREEEIRRKYWSSMMALGSRMVRFEDKGDSMSAWRVVDALLEMGK